VEPLERIDARVDIMRAREDNGVSAPPDTEETVYVTTAVEAAIASMTGGLRTKDRINSIY